MTTQAQKNIKATALMTQANNLRREIDQVLIPNRKRLAGKTSELFLEGLDLALEQAEDRYIALVNEANSILRA
jgi:capsid portal protein